MEATPASNSSSRYRKLPHPQRYHLSITHLSNTTPSQFVQCLANPLYLNHLAAQKYLDDPSFIAYLAYLQYFAQPKYTKYLTCASPSYTYNLTISSF